VKLITDPEKPARLAALRGIRAARLKFSNLVRLDTRDATTSLGDERVRKAMTANQLFVTLMNPHDRRKNLQELLLGFVNATAQHPDAVLIVKLVLPPRAQVPGVLHSDILPRFERPISLESDRILFISEYLADEQLSALYDIADFYLCASVAEGQNLPLIESMGRGVIPVSPITTAMLDYLSENNCVPIRTRPFAGFERRTGADVAQRPYSVAFCSQTDIGRALVRACALPQMERQRMRRNAVRTIQSTFSTHAVGALVQQRIEAIQRDARPANKAP
jgi:glycosyltransferase involved in cell wall biosynthesis